MPLETGWAPATRRLTALLAPVSLGRTLMGTAGDNGLADLGRASVDGTVGGNSKALATWGAARRLMALLVLQDSRANGTSGAGGRETGRSRACWTGRRLKGDRKDARLGDRV